MTVTPIIAYNPAGVTTKILSDSLFLDNKEAQGVYESLIELYEQGWEAGRAYALEHYEAISLDEVLGE